jgi:hypothetical protein
VHARADTTNQTCNIAHITTGRSKTRHVTLTKLTCQCECLACCAAPCALYSTKKKRQAKLLELSFLFRKHCHSLATPCQPQTWPGPMSTYETHLKLHQFGRPTVPKPQLFLSSLHTTGHPKGLQLAIINQNIHEAKQHIEKTSSDSIAQTSELLLSQQRGQSASNNVMPSPISIAGAASGSKRASRSSASFLARLASAKPADLLKPNPLSKPTASPSQTPRQPLATLRPPTKADGACTRKKVRAGCALPAAWRAPAGNFAYPAGLRSLVKLHPEPRLVQERNQPNLPWLTRSAYPQLGHGRAAGFRPPPPATADNGLAGNRGFRTRQGSQTSHSPQTGPTSMGNIPERSSNDCCRQVLASRTNATTSPALVFS